MAGWSPRAPLLEIDSRLNGVVPPRSAAALAIGPFRQGHFPIPGRTSLSENGRFEVCGQQAPPPSKAEIDKLLAVAPSYGIEIRLPQH